jgi:hypothetical protein
MPEPGRRKTSAVQQHPIARMIPDCRHNRSLGFVAAEPVSFNPFPGTVYLGLKL